MIETELSAPPCPFGSHRAEGRLPQSVWRVDNTMKPAANEVLIDVDTLNIDSASMREIADAADSEPGAMKARIADIVKERGKLHNPATGSGGMLVGTVRQVGPEFPDASIRPGERICTMVSLSLTPLVLHEIHAIDLPRCQVLVTGQAIIFASGLLARPPKDIPEPLALAIFDVAGAPATVLKIARPGQRIAVLGAAGKAGLLCLAAASERVGDGGQVIAVDRSAKALEEVRALGFAGRIVEADLQDPIPVYRAVRDATGGQMADLTANTANVPGTEGSSILATKQGGKIYFFNMATSFQAAALTAEGVGRDVELLIGNGYTTGWVEETLSLLERQPALKQVLLRRYAA